MGLSKSPLQSVDLLRLESTRVLDGKGNAYFLRSLWSKDSTTVLVFIRHFACIACRAHVAQILQFKKQFESKGSKVIFLGHGSSEALADFKKAMNLEDTLIFTDPSRESFLACSFKKSFLNLISASSAIHMTKLALKGHRQSKYDKSMGIHRQMGGIVVIKKGRKVAFHYISEAVGDFPPEEKVLEQVSEDLDSQR